MLGILKFIIYGFIQLIEFIEYWNVDIDENDISKKIINTIKLRDIEIWTDTGWHETSHIHTVQPYQIWKFKTENGKFLECADNHIIFDENLNEIFVKDLRIGSYVMTENGSERIIEIKRTRNKVGMFDLTVDSEDHRYYTNGILSHNTITSSIFLTWYLLFHYDKNVLLMANKGATTKEIMDKIKAIVEGLPFFLKPGIIKKDIMSMMFDNRCRIIGQNTTKTGGIGFTIHLLFLDEFAHIQENIKRPFYENVYPTLSSSKISRVIITSTPNGYDLFHDLYQGSVDGMNEYTHIRVDWWEVPGRDDEWKRQEISNLGSEEAFNQQYGCQFLNSSSLLLDSEQIRILEKRQRDFIFQEIFELDDLCIDYSQLKWDPEFDLIEIEDKSTFFVFSIDIAEGLGKDYTVANIFKISPIYEEDIKRIKSPESIKDFFTLEQIGIFRSNIHSIEDFSKILYTLCVKVFDQENLRLVIEYNTYGAELVRYLMTLYPTSNDFEEECIVKYKHRVSSKHKNLGLRLNKDNKILYCEKMKREISHGQLIIKDDRTITEARNFTRNSNGTYSAQSGHDDCIMTCVNISSFFDTLDYIEIIEELFDELDSNRQNLIDDILEAKENNKEDIFDSIL